MAKEKRGFLAKLNSKGLENSVSEDQARHMASHQGSRYMLVVEVHSGRKVIDEDGSETIHLIPDLVELVPPEHEDRVRKFQRALYMERPEQIGQRSIEGISDLEPTSEDVGGEIDAVTTDYPDPAEGTWDGNPDAALDAPANDEASETEGQPDSPPCPAQWCTLPEGHEGDHNQDGLAAAEDAGAPETQPAVAVGANVVPFSH